MNTSRLQDILNYHQATKHHFHRHARSLGFMDWTTQPAPFRRFDGCEIVDLEIPDLEAYPTWDSLFGEKTEAAALNRESLSQFFYLSMALSAWKQVVSPEGEILSRWALRVNPSSGNLHPTESYVVLNKIPGLCDNPTLFHYAPDIHGLEKRGEFSGESYEELDKTLNEHSFLAGLTSIHWREAWKYGERAFRYCQHDVGHAMAALSLAGTCLGWDVEMLPGVPHSSLESFLGTGAQSGPEKEHPDLLLRVGPSRSKTLPESIFQHQLKLMGSPNTLSPSHQDWPIIDEVATASMSPVVGTGWNPPSKPIPFSDRNHPASRIIRQRRSAVSMDGKTTMELDDFTRLLWRVMPENATPFSTLGHPPLVSLVLFVHRVNDLEPGLFCLVRHPDHEVSLREKIRSEFSWQKPKNIPSDLPLYRWVTGDVSPAAQQLSCHQAIAAEGAFSLGMLAQFQTSLESFGQGVYRQLFWETGMIGQMLYLEAEAAGLRGTGIGCFYDDEVHRLLGFDDQSWQSLYHFTVGGPVDDDRLQTAGAYDHLSR